MRRKATITLGVIAMFFVFFTDGLHYYSKTADAHGWRSCGRCSVLDCLTTELLIEAYHNTGEAFITNHITTQFAAYRLWLEERFFRGHLLPAMMLMTE